MQFPHYWQIFLWFKNIKPHTCLQRQESIIDFSTNILRKCTAFVIIINLFHYNNNVKHLRQLKAVFFLIKFTLKYRQIKSKTDRWKTLLFFLLSIFHVKLFIMETKKYFRCFQYIIDVKSNSVLFSRYYFIYWPYVF